MVRRYEIFLLLLCLSSCSSYFFIPNYIIEGFDLCYNKDMQNSTSFNIDGYYRLQRIKISDGLNKNKTHSPDTSFLNMMFFNDGVFLYNFEDVNFKRREIDPTSNINLYFKEITNDSIQDVLFRNSFKWGLYKIINDTIKTQITNHPPKIAATWSAWEIWFKVIDENTIIMIDIKPINTPENSNNYIKYYQNEAKTVDTATFIHLSNIPSSDCWLMKEKWFWCNEKDWKNYMDSIVVK